MALLDDVMKLAGNTPANPVIPNSWEKDYNQVFQEANAASTVQAQKEDKGFLESTWEWVRSLWNAGTSAAEHFFQNEDEDLGITDWKKYQQFQDEIKTNPKYTEQERQAKETELYQQGVINDEYYANIRRQRNTVINAESPDTTVEAKIRKDLTAQLSTAYAQTTDPDVVRILNQAIETQSETYMDYYRRIAGSDNAFDKTLAFQKLSEFMKQWESFMRDYADNVLKTKDNVSAYKTTASQYEWYIRDMDAWNSKLTTSSRWAGVKGSITGLFDSDFDIADDIGNIWWAGTGLINMVTGILGWAVHQTKRNVFGSYNSGMEELRLDYIEKPTDSWTTYLSGKMSQGIGEIWDGADTLIESVVPIFAASKIGLLTKTENAARLIEGTGTANKALGYTKYFWTQMLQDALVFDNAFQTFQKRGTNQDERTTNFWTNAVFNAGITTLLGKPVLKASREFEEILKWINYDVRGIGLTEDLVRAANAGEVEYAERGIYKTVKDMSEGIDPPPAVTTLTDVGKKNMEKIVSNTNRTLNKMQEWVLTDNWFAAQKTIQNALEWSSSKVKPSEAILSQQKTLTEQTIKEVVTQKATNGSKTIAQMNNNSTTEQLLRQAMDLLANQAKPLDNTAAALTKDIQESILNKIKSIKAGDTSVSFTPIEEIHVARLGEQIVDVVKGTDDVTLSQAFNKDITPIARITPSIPYKTLMTYEELAQKISSEPVRATYKEFVESTFKKNGTVRVDSIMPADAPGFITPFMTRVNRKFGNIDTGEINMRSVTDTLSAIPGKSTISSTELDALKLYHFPMLYEHFQKLKTANLLSDVSDEKLFASHPFFKLFEKTEDWFRAIVPIRDYKDVDSALGLLFNKMTRADIKELSVMKYVLKEEKFKDSIIRMFEEVNTSIAPTDRWLLWELAQKVFMDPVTLKQIENLSIVNKLDGNMILKKYIEKVIHATPQLEWAYYATWLKRLPDRPFFLNKPYVDYARDFDKYLDEFVKSAELPANMDRVKLKNILLSKGLDEVVVLNQVDYEAALHAYHRSSLSPDIIKLEELRLSMELATPAKAERLQTEISILESEIKRKSRLVNSGSVDRNNVTLVLDSLQNNPKKYVSLWADTLRANAIQDNLRSILASTDALSFEHARQNLRESLMATMLNHEDFVDLQELLLIPKELLGDRKEYLGVIQKLLDDNFEEAVLYKDAAIARHLFAGVKSMEEAASIVNAAIAKYKSPNAVKFSTTNDAIWSIDRPGLYEPLKWSVADIPAKSIIIVDRASNNPLDIIRKQKVTGSGDTQFMTLYELNQFLYKAENRYAGKRNAETTRMFYSNFRKTHGDIYISANAFQNYANTFARHPGTVAKDTEAMNRAFANLKPYSQGWVFKLLPDNLHLSKQWLDTSIAVTGIESADVLKSLEDAKFISDDSKHEISAIIPGVQKALGIDSIQFPVPALRAKNVLDTLFSDSNMGMLYKTIRKNFDKLNNDSIDLLKYAEGPDFKKSYKEYLRKTKALLGKNDPDIKDLPWVFKAFQLSEREFLDLSRVHVLAKDLNLSADKALDLFSIKIKENFIEKLVHNDIAAQRYSTYFLLKGLKDNGITVPDMSRRELFQLVDQLEPQTVAKISSITRHFLNEARLKEELLSERGFSEWVRQIETSLKEDSVIQPQIVRWGLAWDVDMSKIPEPVAELDDPLKALTDALDSPAYSEEEAMKLFDERQKAVREKNLQRVAELEFAHPDLFGKGKNADDAALDISKLSEDEIAKLRSETPEPTGTDYSPLFATAPTKLESVQLHRLFEYLSKKFNAQLERATKDIYSGRVFTPYMNLSRDIKPTDDVYKAFSRTASYKPENVFFKDPAEYTMQPELLTKDIKQNNFFAYNWEKIVQIRSQSEAKDTLMYALNRAIRSKDDGIVFNFYVTPKESKIKLSDTGSFTAPGKTFIDPKEIEGLPSFLNGGKSFENSPLFKWAFQEEIASNTPLLAIVERWAAKNWDAGRRVLRNFESFFWLSPAPLNLSSNMFEKVQTQASQRFLREELTKLVPLETNDSIMSIELLGYKPTVQLISPDTGEFTGVRIAQKYLLADEVERPLYELFGIDDLKWDISEETILEDLVDQGTFRIRTFSGRVIDYWDDLPSSVNISRPVDTTELTKELQSYGYSSWESKEILENMGDDSLLDTISHYEETKAIANDFDELSGLTC